MRLLHVSDVHCATENLSRVLAEESYDLVVVSGDVECVETAEVLRDHAERAVAVTGNLDDVSVRRALNELGVLIDGRVKVVGGLTFAGIGGLDVRSDVSSLLKLGLSNVDVLVSHYPPRRVLDKTWAGVRIGLNEVLQASRALRPALHLFGHVHESPGWTSYGEGTVAVNPGPLLRGRYAIIYYERGSPPRVELKALRTG